MLVGILLMWWSGGLLAMGGIQPYDCPPSLVVDWAAPFTFLPWDCLKHTWAHVPMDVDAPGQIDANYASDMPQHAAYGPISAVRARNGAVFLPPESKMNNTNREHSHVPLLFRYLQAQKALAAVIATDGDLPADSPFTVGNSWMRKSKQSSPTPKWRRNMGYYLMANTRGVVSQLGYFIFWTGLQQQLQLWMWASPDMQICMGQAMVGLVGAAFVGSLLGAAGVDAFPLYNDDDEDMIMKRSSTMDARRIDFESDGANKDNSEKLLSRAPDSEEDVPYVPMTALS